MEEVPGAGPGSARWLATEVRCEADKAGCAWVAIPEARWEEDSAGLEGRWELESPCACCACCAC